jgi:hypothetical protein
MSRVCTICTHPERIAIEAALRRGDSFRQVAQAYGIPLVSLHRHAHRHVPEIARARAEPQAPPGSRRCVDCGELYTEGSNFRCRECLSRPYEVLRKFYERGKQKRLLGEFDKA